MAKVDINSAWVALNERDKQHGQEYFIRFNNGSIQRPQ